MAGKTAENYFLREVLRFFSASCSTTLAMDIAIAIMKVEIVDEYIVVMLNDIRDLNNIASTGFQFATRGVNKAYRGQKLLTQSPINNGCRHRHNHY